MKHIFLSVIWIVGAVVGYAQSLHGNITLEKTDNLAPLATIRIPDLGIGTTAKLDGTYSVTGIKQGKHIVEYSFIGYKTVRKEIAFENGSDVVENVNLEETPIMLNAVFVTPDGSDPAHFIAKKMLENAARKYAAVRPFTITCESVLSFQDFEFFNILPKTTRSMFYFVAGLAGFKGVIKMLVNHPEMDCVTTNSGTCDGKKWKWGTEEVKKCNVELSDDEKKAINKMSPVDNLYEQIYDDNNFKEKKAEITMKGSYLDGDDLIYVLQAEKNGCKDIFHVKDDTWDVVKCIFNDGIEQSIVELRQVVGELYLPVSYNMKVQFGKMTAEELKKILEQTENKQQTEKQKVKQEKKKQKTMNKIMSDKTRREAFESIKQKLMTRGLNMTVNQGSNFHYKSNSL